MNLTQWTVVGAGPAGIAVVGNLLDQGVNPDHILWIDPDFQGGDLGQKWLHVSSNTKVKLFLDYLHACSSFGYGNCPMDFDLNHLPPEDTCTLRAIADPLQWVTNHLQQTVPHIKGVVERFENKENIWHLTLRDGKSVFSERVILATGADPITKAMSLHKPLIPIDVVLNPELLKHDVGKDDVIAVFGSSHTAIIALYTLMNMGIKVVNFYRSPLKYAVYHDDWILYDNTGLKGYSATWAKEFLEKHTFPHLERIHVEDPLYQEKYASCTKSIQAIGFERRGEILKDLSYDHKTGKIHGHQGLYGAGIGFPEGYVDRAGNFEYRVGMWKFMDYIRKVLPMWIDTATENQRGAYTSYVSTGSAD